MKINVTKVDVWAAGIRDEPGGLAEKLETLAEAGASLEFVIARREASRPGTGVVFVTPLKGSKQTAAGRKAGFEKTRSLHSLRLECADRPGLGAKLTRALADVGVNLRGLSAAALGRKCVLYLALDSSDDVRAAKRAISRIA